MKASDPWDSIFSPNALNPLIFTLMEKIDRSCIFNILHVCDFIGEYSDLTPFSDYPGHVINFGHRAGIKGYHREGNKPDIQKTFYGRHGPKGGSGNGERG